MKEQLVSFEIAKLAKEKEFKAQSYHLINIEKYTKETYIYQLPTQSLLQKWLREVHKLSIEINTPDGKSGKWSYEVHKINGYGNYAIGKIGYNTYEEALEAGLLEVLKLIKV